MHNFETRFTDVCWPAIPQPHSAAQLAVLFELNESQWQAPDQIEAWQFRQLEHVVRHAHKEVPFYRKCFDALNLDPRGAISRDQWRVLPLLTRRDLQLSGSELHSRNVPDGHGPVTSAATSGSTNAPVTTLGTSVTEFFWRVLTLREHFWHRRDFSQRFAAIRYSKDQRAQPPDGQVSDNWGAATAGVIKTGPAFLLDIHSTVEEQASWLLRVDPAYVLGYPSALLGIARLFEQQGHQLQQLREVRTFGEILEPECRAVCQRVFGVKIVDMYSSQEVGYIALQCPEHEHYHVQSENVLVEVVDQAGKPCMTGEVGKVVVTTLHNFAMPLLRYDIGDYAEVGAPCPCGRGLPVLKRIRVGSATCSYCRLGSGAGQCLMPAIVPRSFHRFFSSRLFNARLSGSKSWRSANNHSRRRKRRRSSATYGKRSATRLVSCCDALTRFAQPDWKVRGFHL